MVGVMKEKPFNEDEWLDRILNDLQVFSHRTGGLAGCDIIDHFRKRSDIRVRKHEKAMRAKWAAEKAAKQ